MCFRRFSRAVPAGLIALSSLTQSGCLTNYMWQSRLVTAGEHHEGRTKFSGNLHDARFDVAGNLAIPGTMAYADGATKAGALVLRRNEGHLRELNAMLSGESADDVARVSLVSRPPCYGIGMEPTVEPERLALAEATFDETLSRESLASRGYGVRCRLMPQWVPKNQTPEFKAFEARYRDPELCNPGIEITYDTLRYDPDYDGWDTASKTVLTPLTAAGDLASVPVFVGLAIAATPIMIPYAIVAHKPPMDPVPEPVEAGKLRPFFCLVPDGPGLDRWTGLRDYENDSRP